MLFSLFFSNFIQILLLKQCKVVRYDKFPAERDKPTCHSLQLKIGRYIYSIKSQIKTAGLKNNNNNNNN